MKVLVTGDWHIGVTQYGVIDSDGNNSRLVDIESVLNQIVDHGISASIDMLVCTGDIFHTNRPTVHEQLVFFRLLKRLEGAPFKSRFIIGNHDYNSKLGFKHALGLFTNMYEPTGGDDHIVIYDKTSWEYFEDDAGILAVCFYPYHGQQPDYATVKHGTYAKAVVCHSHLEGAVVGAEPFEIKSDSVTRFSDLPVDFVWAGHFHKPQLLSQKPIAFYPGSIQAVDFNERNDTKGVVIFDTVTHDMRTLPVHCRQLVQIDIDATAAPVELTNDMLDSVAECIVKVNVTLSEDDADKFDEVVVRERLLAAGAHSIASINVEVIRQQLKRNPAIKLESSLTNNFESFMNDRNYGKLTDDVRLRGLEIIKQCGL